LHRGGGAQGPPIGLRMVVALSVGAKGGGRGWAAAIAAALADAAARPVDVVLPIGGAMRRVVWAWLAAADRAGGGGWRRPAGGVALWGIVAVCQRLHMHLLALAERHPNCPLVGDPGITRLRRRRGRPLPLGPAAGGAAGANHHRISPRALEAPWLAAEGATAGAARNLVLLKLGRRWVLGEGRCWPAPAAAGCQLAHAAGAGPMRLFGSGRAGAGAEQPLIFSVLLGSALGWPEVFP